MSARQESAAPRALVVVVHDVAPATWAACERLLRSVREVAPIRVSLLAVPRYHLTPPDAVFEEWLGDALARGDELVLHGYTHLDEGRPHGLLDYARRHLYTAGEGEFAALPQFEAAWRLHAGIAWFERHRWPLRGFVAPAWLMSGGTWQALEALGFEYTCTLNKIVSLRRQAAVRSQSIVYSTRSAWRRVVSRPWNAALARHQRASPLLRLELHPADAEHNAIRRSWMRLLERGLHDRQALPLAEAAELADEPLHPPLTAASPPAEGHAGEHAGVQR